MALSVRKPGFSFPDRIPRHWLGGGPLLTHVYNAFTLIFSDDERYPIRVIHRASREIPWVASVPDVRAFLIQELQHASEHQRFL